MNKLVGYAVVAVIGGAVGYALGKGKIVIPKEFAVNIPYGPKVSYKQK